MVLQKVYVGNMKKDILHMKISPDLKERLKRLAEQDNRTLSNLIETILVEYVRRRDAP